MKLCNFSNTNYHLDWYEQDWNNLKKFLDANGLAGIELLLHGNYDINNIPKNMVKGLHLSYFPTWLAFYKGDCCKHDFPTENDLINTFGGLDKNSIHDRFRRDFEVAKALEVEYMVYHVGHVTTEHAFTYEFDYSNREVMSHTLEIVNDVFKGEGPKLLFENLWWPGLTLLDKEELKWFMGEVKYENKGVMLDLSHLMITNKHTKSSGEAIDYILETLDNLGEEKRWIEGIHINGTDVYQYMNQDHRPYYEAYQQAEGFDKFQVIYDHISSMDQHKPLKDERLKEIIEKIRPKYEMIEVVGSHKEVWENYVIEQLKVINAI